MTQEIAAKYWATTAVAHFDTMTSPLQPGETDSADEPGETGDLRRGQAPRRYRLPPLAPSQRILDAIAACAPGSQAETSKPDDHQPGKPNAASPARSKAGTTV